MTKKRFAVLGPDASEQDDQAFVDFLKGEDEDDDKAEEEDEDEPARRHLKGTKFDHDQSDHGKWADGDGVPAAVAAFEAAITGLHPRMQKNEWGQVWDRDGNPLNPSPVQGSPTGVNLYPTAEIQARAAGGIASHMHPAKEGGIIPDTWVSLSDGDVVLHIHAAIEDPREDKEPDDA